MHGLRKSCDFRAESNRRRTVRARNSPHATGAICPGADQPIGAIPDKLLDPVRSSDLHPGKRVKHRVRLVGPATPRRMSGEHIVLERFAGFSPVPPELIPLLCGPDPAHPSPFHKGSQACSTAGHAPWPRMHQHGRPNRVAVGRRARACLVLKARRAAKVCSTCSRSAQVPELDVAIRRA